MFQEERRPVRAPEFIELSSVNELARLVCALERAPLPIFAIKKPNSSEVMLATQLDLFVGSPIFYYANSDEVKQFLSYRTTASGEDVALVDTPSNPAMIYAPIIEIVKLPKIFQQALDSKTKYTGPKFLSLQVKDMMSILKVATYKVMFEEPPLPMFAFPATSRENGWIVGSFTRIEEYEEASIFFYYEQDGRPEQNYAGYSTSRSQAFLTNRTDEHGNLYVKIIRLKEPHPLVETD